MVMRLLGSRCSSHARQTTVLVHGELVQIQYELRIQLARVDTVMVVALQRQVVLQTVTVGWLGAASATVRRTGVMLGLLYPALVSQVAVT